MSEYDPEDELAVLYGAICDYVTHDLETTLFYFHRPEYLDEVEHRALSYFSDALRNCGHMDADHSVKYIGLVDEPNRGKGRGKGREKEKEKGRISKTERKRERNNLQIDMSDDSDIEIDDEDTIDLRFLVCSAVEEAMQFLGIPPRSRYLCDTGDPNPGNNDPKSGPLTGAHFDRVHARVTYLNSIVYPAQRSPAWYLSRYLLFTASAISKLLTTVAQYNSLIYEKCNLPIQTTMTMHERDTGPREALCPLTWGIKYEPLSAMVYEHLNPGAVVRTTYGCIQHPLYTFIGASPDGIVVNPDSPKYGRLVEIKNIWNREITGVPKLEYFVQMQFQMDVCELPVCEFVETRFKEYGNAAECFADEAREDYGRGVILYFSGIVPPETGVCCMFDEENEENATDPSGVMVNTTNEHEEKGEGEGEGERTFQLKPRTVPVAPSFYVYMPFYVRMVPWAVDAYISEQKTKYASTHTLCQVSYWYLDEYSCVQVDHNPPWIAAVLPVIAHAWEEVEMERKSGGGAPSRAPKKRAPKTSVDKCLFD